MNRRRAQTITPSDLVGNDSVCWSKRGVQLRGGREQAACHARIAICSSIHSLHVGQQKEKTQGCPEIEQLSNKSAS